jgi:hypothetical protein
MLRRVSPLGLLLLASACSRVPADVSSPGVADSSTTTPTGERASAEPIPGECRGAELSTCAVSCSDADCLEWCAGRACAATIASLWSCMDEAERRYAAEHPVPEADHETVTDEDGNSYLEPTEESLERQYEWAAARDLAMDEHWGASCQSICEAGLPFPEPDETTFCPDWRSTYASWARLSEPAPKDSRAGILALASSAGMFGMLSIGTSVWLVGELAENYEDPHAAPLQGMVNRAGWELRDADSCVPDLDASGREFTIAVQLDDHGAVQATDVRDGETGAGQCVAEQLATAFHLPVRVARDYPQLEVRVWVRPEPDYGGLGTGFDTGIDTYDIGGLGEAGWGYGGAGEDPPETGDYGVMGTGDAATGYGGGGGGWGYGSVNIEPPPEPEPEPKN